MGDRKNSLQMLGFLEETLVASAARTTTGNSGALTEFGYAKEMRLQLDVTAASGTTPTLDVIVEDSVDGTNWNTIVTFAQKTTTGREVLNFTGPFADRLRVTWTIGGTGPSFTFSLKGVLK